MIKTAINIPKIFSVQWKISIKNKENYITTVHYKKKKVLYPKL